MPTLRYTPHQVARGTRADAEKGDRLYLLKNVSMLRATYQIRLLLYMAQVARKKLVLRVPKICKLASDMTELRREHPNTLIVERV